MLQVAGDIFARRDLLHGSFDSCVERVGLFGGSVPGERIKVHWPVVLQVERTEVDTLEKFLLFFEGAPHVELGSGFIPVLQLPVLRQLTF